MQNLFIIGSPRSGTTFLASLLKPTEYGAPFETQFILKYYEKIKEYGDITQLPNLTKLLNDISSERAISQWKVPLVAKEIKDDLDDSYNYNDVVDAICLKLMGSKNKGKWGDKTPHYILKLKQLITLYPEAKYLYIVRDGRDVALSLLKKPWGPNNIYKCAEQWVEANNNAQQLLLNDLKEKGQILFIKYEELLEKTEDECRRIYKFLDDDIENHRTMVNELISKTMSDNSSKWKTKMTSKQIEVYEAIAKESLLNHQYELINPQAKLPTLKKIGYKFHHQFIYAKHMFVMNVIDGIKIKFFGKQPFNE
jgi:hypothetical protein